MFDLSRREGQLPHGFDVRLPCGGSLSVIVLLNHRVAFTVRCTCTGSCLRAIGGVLRVPGVYFCGNVASGEKHCRLLYSAAPYDFHLFC